MTTTFSRQARFFPSCQFCQGSLRLPTILFYSVLLLLPSFAMCEEREWSLGVYGGQYYDSEPAVFTQGNANYLSQYMIAITASKKIWESESFPMSLEIDGMIGYQFGLAAISEFAVAPVLRWHGFPWNGTLQTDLRVGPLGVSYTVPVSPLERGKDGSGSQFLNFLLIELAFSLPAVKSKEVFLRLHHRCTIYDLINNYGANGEDFLALGYRQYF